MRRRDFMLGCAAALLAMPAGAAEARGEIIITGDMGTVGSRLVPYFKGLGYEVWGIDKRRPEFPWDLANEAPPDIMEDVPGHFQRTRAIVHLAADANPNASWDSVKHNNIYTMLNMLRAARYWGINKFVFASSTFASPGAYGNPDYLSMEPVNDYGRGKAISEDFGRIDTSRGNLNFTTIRIGVVPAPHQLPLKNAWLESIRVPDDVLCNAFYGAMLLGDGYHQIDCIGNKWKEVLK